MITVTKLLRNPLFVDAKIVAGKKGAKKKVEWSYVTDTPNTIEILGGGNGLIITTSHSLPKKSAKQDTFIPQLVKAGLIGIVISVKDVSLPNIPDTLINAADSLEFPIIVVPQQVKFSDISQVIHEQTLSRNYALLKQSDRIHQTLTQIVLEGGGLQDVADVLVKLVHRSVTIEDPSLSVLASSDYGESDPARQKTIDSGGTPPELLERLAEEKILEKVQHSLRPVQVGAWPDLGMTRERIVAPIVVERKIYGYLWFVATDEPLNESDMMTVERAAIVAALTMLKDSSVRQTEARLQADIISQLLSDEPHSLALQDKLNRLGLDLSVSQRVMLLRPPGDTLPSLRLADKLILTIHGFTSNIIIQAHGRNLILILPSQIDTQEISEALLKVVPDLHIGIGKTAPTLDDLPQSYREGKEALEIGLALIDDNRIYHFESLGFLHWLYHLPAEALNGNIYAERINLLSTEEKAERAQLLRTLEIFLDCGGNAAETARMLRIHRNTLSYRLKQIETYCKMSLQDPETRLNLQIAVKAFRLIAIRKKLQMEKDDV